MSDSISDEELVQLLTTLRAYPIDALAALEERCAMESRRHEETWGYPPPIHPLAQQKLDHHAATMARIDSAIAALQEARATAAPATPDCVRCSGVSAGSSYATRFVHLVVDRSRKPLCPACRAELLTWLEPAART